MSLIEILPEYEVKRFDRPGVLSKERQIELFKIDSHLSPYLDKTKSVGSKIGFLIQYGYFSANNKFFTQDKFRKADIAFIANTLNVSLSKNCFFDYGYRIRQKHRLLILKILGYTSTVNSADTIDSLITEMVEKQTHPRKIISSLVEILSNKKIEIPSYNYIARIVTEKFNIFEKELTKKIEKNITIYQKEALDHLLGTIKGGYQRPLLTRLKKIYHSTRPAKIKHSIRNFLIIKKLFSEIDPIIGELNLSNEAIRYYAQWIIKAQSYQAEIIAESNKKYVYLIAFVAYYFRIWQDVFVDILLKSVQQQLNKVEKISTNITKETLPEKNKLATSVLSGFQEAKVTIEAVSRVLYDSNLDNNSKLLKLYYIVPAKDKTTLLKQAVKDAEQLKNQIDNEKHDRSQIHILATLSRKLQNRVAEIVKYLTFSQCSDNYELMTAIEHYQASPNITSAAPRDFLTDIERELIYKGSKFKVSLYKAILFCKISTAIKSGQISLTHSYRYLSLDSYLLDVEYWQKNKLRLLKDLNLEPLINIESILNELEEELDKKFFEVNNKIVNQSNSYAKIHKDDHLSVYTPPIAKPDYNSVSEIIGKNKYIPILQMMSEINKLTSFTTHFKHHKIKATKEKPNSSNFYAGIFALGSGIGLHKLANTAIGINYNTLSSSINWYFSLDNLRNVNQELIKHMKTLSLPNKFKREQALLHTSSDAQKKCVSAESLNADYSYKYHGNAKGVSIYRFIDERGILFYSNVFGSAERDAAYVIDGLCNNGEIYSDIHSTDTLGYTEIVFGIANLIGILFAPRIKNLMSQNLVSFKKIKSELDSKNYSVVPSYYAKPDIIKDNWDTILRLIVTIKTSSHKASVILKRLNSYPKQHPLQHALKEFGRVIKSIFILKYIDDVELRQSIEKQLNKGELANKFASAVSFASESMVASHKEDQEIFAMCQTIIQNVIILWNYIELTKIIMRSDLLSRKALIDNITSASILTWQHVNMHGTYDFSNLHSTNDNDFNYAEVMNFKIA